MENKFDAGKVSAGGTPSHLTPKARLEAYRSASLLSSNLRGNAPKRDPVDWCKRWPVS